MQVYCVSILCIYLHNACCTINMVISYSSHTPHVAGFSVSLPSFYAHTGPLPYSLSLSGLAAGSHELALVVGDGTRQFQFLIPFSVSEPCKCINLTLFSCLIIFPFLFTLPIISALPLQFQCQSDTNDSAISISCTTNKEVTLDCYYDESMFTPCKHLNYVEGFLATCMYHHMYLY